MIFLTERGHLLDLIFKGLNSSEEQQQFASDWYSGDRERDKLLAASLLHISMINIPIIPISMIYIEQSRCLGKGLNGQGCNLT